MAMITLPESKSYSVVSNSLQSRGLNSPWDSPGQNTGVGSRSLLQGIFPTQGSNPGLPHCRWILYQLSHEGSSRILAWVAYPFWSGSSRLRNWTGVSCIAGRFLTSWATREAQEHSHFLLYANSFNTTQRRRHPAPSPHASSCLRWEIILGFLHQKHLLSEGEQQLCSGMFASQTAWEPGDSVSILGGQIHS